MSKYTNELHRKALEDTEFWDHHNPKNPEELFLYGEYQWCLKDYRMAVPVFKKAAKYGILSAYYRLGEAYWYGCGCTKNRNLSKHQFHMFLKTNKTGDIKKKEIYFAANCYKNGWGTMQNLEKAIQYYRKLGFRSAWGLMGLGKIYKYQGKITQAKTCFKMALDIGHLEAPFYLYEISGYDLLHFAYKRELFEHFSFILGRLMRVAELHPCKEYYDRLAWFYETAIPNDYTWNQEKFKKISKKYYQLGKLYKEK